MQNKWKQFWSDIKFQQTECISHTAKEIGVAFGATSVLSVYITQTKWYNSGRNCGPWNNEIRKWISLGQTRVLSVVILPLFSSRWLFIGHFPLLVPFNTAFILFPLRYSIQESSPLRAVSASDNNWLIHVEHNLQFSVKFKFISFRATNALQIMTLWQNRPHEDLFHKFLFFQNNFLIFQLQWFQKDLEGLWNKLFILVLLCKPFLGSLLDKSTRCSRYFLILKVYIQHYSTLLKFLIPDYNLYLFRIKSIAQLSWPSLFTVRGVISLFYPRFKTRPNLISIVGLICKQRRKTSANKFIVPKDSFKCALNYWLLQGVPE